MNGSLKYLSGFILFYTCMVVATPCEHSFDHTKSQRRMGQFNGTTKGMNDSVSSTPAKLRTEQPSDKDTIESLREAVHREQSVVWESLFPQEYLIAISDIPQLSRKEQRVLMYKIVSMPENSVFDVKERVKWLKALFEQGVDVNTQNGSGGRLLHIAAGIRGIAGRYLVNFLLKNGADAYIENQAGQTPLEVAHERGNSETAKLLQTHIQ